MKVLQLCNKPPYPPVDGGTIAMHNITQSLLKKGCTIKVLSAYSYKHPFTPKQLDPQYAEATRFEAIYFDLKPNPFKALFYFLTGESYHIARFKNKKFNEALVRILKEEEFDIIQLESLFMTPYVETIRKHSKGKIILRSHNVEHLIWQRIAKSTKNIFKRIYMKHLALTLKNYEMAHLNSYDGMACISTLDANFFKNQGFNKPITVIPFGLSTIEYVDNVEEEPNSLFHIGSMNWQPNIEGIHWFLKKVWGKVHKEIPLAKLYLAGREMPSHLLKSKYPNVKILGEIPDAMYFIASKQINVVPLLSGSGIRVKIIEAMSIGKTVITTSIGAEGIKCTHGVDILIANTPDEFVKSIKLCIEEPAVAKEIGQKAAELISREHNSEKIVDNLILFYEKVTKI